MNVGSFVWYHPAATEHIAGSNGPLAAIVVGVQADGTLNLAVFDANGFSQGRSGVLFFSGDGQRPTNQYASEVGDEGPAATDTPDENGLVELLRVPAWKGWRHNIAEITASLTGDQQAKSLANLSHANGEYRIAFGFIGAAYESTVAASVAQLDISKPILSTTSWPDAVLEDGATSGSTVAGVESWCSSHPKPGPNPNAPSFPHP